jgi:hypothetical protein
MYVPIVSIMKLCIEKNNILRTPQHFPAFPSLSGCSSLVELNRRPALLPAIACLSSLLSTSSLLPAGSGVSTSSSGAVGAGSSTSSSIGICVTSLCAGDALPRRIALGLLVGASAHTQGSITAVGSVGTSIDWNISVMLKQWC